MKKNPYNCYSRTADEMGEIIVPHFHVLERRQCVAGHHFKLHQQRSYELMFVDRGTYGCFLNGVELSLPQYSVLLIKPLDWHEDLCSFDAHFSSLRFKIELFGGAGIEGNVIISGGSVEDRVFRARKSDFWPDLDLIAKETSANDTFCPYLHDHITGCIFWKVLRNLPKSILSPRFISSTEQARFRSTLWRFFESNLHRSCSVSELARAVGMSERLLYEKCQKLLGQSPAKIFQIYRMERGRLLVQETERSFKDISDVLGYSNPYHFSKIYRRCFKMAPSVDRKICRKKITIIDSLYRKQALRE